MCLIPRAYHGGIRWFCCGIALTHPVDLYGMWIDDAEQANNRKSAGNDEDEDEEYLEREREARNNRNDDNVDEKDDDWNSKTAYWKPN